MELSVEGGIDYDVLLKRIMLTDNRKMRRKNEKIISEINKAIFDKERGKRKESNVHAVAERLRKKIKAKYPDYIPKRISANEKIPIKFDVEISGTDCDKTLPR